MRRFPEPVTRAIVATVEWLAHQEDWVIRGRAEARSMRLQDIIEVALDDSPGNAARAARVRRSILIVLSYLPAETRLAFCFTMADRNPDVLEKLLNAPYDKAAEPALHNLAVTLGSFARHSLLCDIFTKERLEKIEKQFIARRALRGSAGTSDTGDDG